MLRLQDLFGIIEFWEVLDNWDSTEQWLQRSVIWPMYLVILLLILNTAYFSRGAVETWQADSGSSLIVPGQGFPFAITGKKI